MLVTSKDLIVTGPNKNVIPVGHSGFCFDDIANIPVTIVKLRQGQTLKLKAIAVKGTGRDHSKWSPVSAVSFTSMPEITFNESVIAEWTTKQRFRLFSELGKCFPVGRNPFCFDDQTRRLMIKPELYNFDDAHLPVLEKFGVPDLVRIEPLQDTFIFKVKSSC